MRRMLLLRTGLVAYSALGLMIACDVAAVAAQDTRAYQLAAEMRLAGASANDVSRELVSRFRLEPPAVARVLRAERIDAPPVAAALAVTFRRTTRELAADLRSAEFAPRDVARGILPLTRGGSEAFESMQLGGFDLGALREAGQFLFARTPADYVAAMKAAGETAHDVALVLRNGYGLDALSGAKLLCEGRFGGVWRPYPAVYMVAALREVWALDIVAAHQVLKDHPYSFNSMWELLESGGYDAVTPYVDGFRIPDYRPGYAGQYLENIGIVNTNRVIGTPESWDGDVELLVRYRELDGLTALNTAGGVETPGQIVDRAPVDHTVNGVAVSGERLRVRFADVRTGSIGLVRTSLWNGKPVLALGYGALDAAAIEGPMKALQVKIGVPKGIGVVDMPAGTYGGVVSNGAELEFTVPTHVQAGSTADVVDLTSNNVSVTTTSIGAGMLNLTIEVGFEETGAEVAGTFVSYVPCWTCAGYQVPRSRCASIDCVLATLGATLTALSPCLNPANWVESEIAAGPAVPFEADLTAPRLTITANIGAQNGSFRVHPMLAQLHAGIALRAGPAGVPLGPLLQNYVLGQVNQRLNQAVIDMNLGGALQTSLEQLRTGLLGSGTLRGIYLLADGRWFTDLSY